MRWLWLGIGWIALAAGAVGLLLPVVPTVPFLLAAVWCFARSSPRMRAAILRHPQFGPPIRDWQRNGTIARPVKLLATATMTGGVIVAILLSLPALLIAAQAAVCAAVAVFLWTRPSRPA